MFNFITITFLLSASFIVAADEPTSPSGDELRAKYNSLREKEQKLLHLSKPFSAAEQKYFSKKANVNIYPLKNRLAVIVGKKADIQSVVNFADKVIKVTDTKVNNGKEVNHFDFANFTDHYYGPASTVSPDQLEIATDNVVAAKNFFTRIQDDIVLLEFQGFGAKYLPRNKVKLHFPSKVLDLSFKRVCQVGTIYNAFKIRANAITKRVLHVETLNGHHYISINGRHSLLDHYPVVNAKDLGLSKLADSAIRPCVLSRTVVISDGTPTGL